MVTENPAERASALMKKGIAFLNSGNREGWEASLPFFDEALAIRRSLPPSAESWAAYVLAASWMNRGDALTKLGGSDNLREAVRSFDEALGVLGAISVDENPLYGRRLAIAWMNRGLALQEEATEEALAQALESFERGIEVLDLRADQKGVAACGWVNRASLLLRLRPPSITEARVSAERALCLARGAEESDLECADAALKARVVLCQAFAEADLGDEARRSDHAAAAGAVVESALEVVQAWEQKGETRFRSQAAQLFRFGVILAQQYHPDELVPFIKKGIACMPMGNHPDAIAALEAAVESLAGVWRRLEREGFAAINTPQLDLWIETLRALRLADSRLRELRSGAAQCRIPAAAK